MRSRGLAALVLAAALGSAAQAQDFVRPECRDPVTLAPIAFDTANHRGWYRRFWTGECDHLPRCIPGSPNWNDMVGHLLARGAPVHREALKLKACRVGRLIGLEWSRSKKIRRIDLDDLREFNRTLEKAGDPLLGLDQVEAAARAKIKG